MRFFVLDVLVTNQQEYNVIYTNIAFLFWFLKYLIIVKENKLLKNEFHAIPLFIRYYSLWNDYIFLSSSSFHEYCKHKTDIFNTLHCTKNYAVKIRLYSENEKSRAGKNNYIHNTNILDTFYKYKFIQSWEKMIFITYGNKNNPAVFLPLSGI